LLMLFGSKGYHLPIEFIYVKWGRFDCKRSILEEIEEEEEDFEIH